MARYDYKCKSCDHEQVTEHGMLEDPEVECEVCQSTDTHKIIKVAPMHTWKEWP